MPNLEKRVQKKVAQEIQDTQKDPDKEKFEHLKNIQRN